MTYKRVITKRAGKDNNQNKYALSAEELKTLHFIVVKKNSEPRGILKRESLHFFFTISYSPFFILRIAISPLQVFSSLQRAGVTQAHHNPSPFSSDSSP